MSKSRGILLDPKTNDLLVIGKSLQEGDVTAQNQYMILTSRIGEIKSQPTQGVGLSDITLDDDTGIWSREIRIQLERDGMTVRSVHLDKQYNLSIDADYR